MLIGNEMYNLGVQSFVAAAAADRPSYRGSGRGKPYLRQCGSLGHRRTFIRHLLRRCLNASKNPLMAVLNVALSGIRGEVVRC